MSAYLPKPTLFLRTDKKKKNGKMPLYIRFQRIDGKEPKFSLGKRGKTFEFSQEEWDNSNKHPYDTELTIIIDNELGRIKKEVNRAVINEEEITIDLLRKIVEGEKNGAIRDKMNHSFLDYFAEYISKKVRTKKIRQSTEDTYWTTYKSIKDFKENIRIRDVNTRLIEDFNSFLIRRGEKKGMGDVYGSRRNRLKHIRSVIKYIGNCGIQIDNPFLREDIAIPSDRENNIFLDFDELKRIFVLITKYKNGSLKRRVLLMYLFSCASGLRISDIYSLTWDKIDLKENPLILTFLPKKDNSPNPVPVSIPLNEDELGVEILLYAPEGDINNVDKNKKVFQLPPYNKVGKVLKLIAKRAKIEKNLDFHSSRRTFATLSYMRGVDIHILQKWLGHKSIRTTERYVKWSPNLARITAERMSLFTVKELTKK